jgi:hypothetical protein
MATGIRDPGWKKITIRDKHPGSAKPETNNYFEIDNLFRSLLPPFIPENPLVRGMDLKIRIWIRTKMSRIPITGFRAFF